MNKILIVLCLYILIGCIEKQKRMRNNIYGRWTLTGSLEENRVRVGNETYTFHENGNYDYKSINNDLIIENEGKFETIKLEEREALLLILIPALTTNSIGDTIRRYHVYEVLISTSEKLVLQPQSQWIHTDTFPAHIINRKYLYTRAK